MSSPRETGVRARKHLGQHFLGDGNVIRKIIEAIARGDLRPVKPTERPLTEARAVLSELLGRQAAGKIVLVP